MAMAGSVVTKDMKYNEIYAGSPAKSISDKIGFQFFADTVEPKFEVMNNYLNEFETKFYKKHNIKIVSSSESVDLEDKYTYFDVSSRQYTKKQNEAEILFMKFLLPAKAKFIPF
jgi:hypothetical protein